MTVGIVSAPARHRRVATCITALSALALGTSLALAQPQPAPSVPAPKATPRPLQPAQKAPATTKQPQQPAQQAPQAPADQQAGAPADQPPIVYSPWTKFCGKDQNQASAKEVCLTVKEARLETGQFLAGAALIEVEGEQKKTFRVTLPLGMQLPQGARAIVDQDPPLPGNYIVCLPNGCMADFDVNADFVGKLKKGQNIALQGINLPGQLQSYPLP